MIPLTKRETLTEAQQWEVLKEEALAQGFCEPCAADTAYGMQHGLGLMGAPCDDCLRRLDPKLVSAGRGPSGVLELRGKIVNKYKVAKGWRTSAPTARRCKNCGGGMSDKRGDARFCSDPCRDFAKRAAARAKNSVPTPS